MAASFSGRVVRMHPFRPDWALAREAARAIRRGELIAMPTDTVYGLAGDPFRPGVAQRIFRVKRRAESQPILLLIASLRELKRVVTKTPDLFYTLAARFWPGPLTIILPAQPSLPQAITAGTGTVAVRWPAAPLTQTLIRAAGVPLTGTSANVSGRPPAATAEEVKRQLGRSIYYIVDGGRARGRRPSTIIDLTAKPRLVRSGALPASQLAAYLK